MNNCISNDVVNLFVSHIFQSYFSKLKKKQLSQVQWDKFDESSDSLSSNEEPSLTTKRTKPSATANKFLKKKKVASPTEEKHKSASVLKDKSKGVPPKPVARNTGLYLHNILKH